MPKYKITKTFGHDSGYSCAFRQWNAKSNCSKIHGYSLGFEINLISHQLDENNWVFNFGDFKFLKKWLRDNFDHTLLIAKDDPFKEKFLELDNLKIANVVELDEISCEKFAEMTFKFIFKHFQEHKIDVVIESVYVSEHSGNKAGFFGD
tara:strand:- start:279 stop:725 length:447 start_codon:yes stop_codon:yes gene_type:complete